MSVQTFTTLGKMAQKLRSELTGIDLHLIFSYNRTDKARLSMEFKDLCKRKNNRNADSLYFNEFSEPLITWIVMGDKKELFLLILRNFTGKFQLHLPDSLRLSANSAPASFSTL